MNELDNFEVYLKKWCKQHHKPVPAEGSLNKYWQEAWTDYMKTELSANWENYVQQYYNIPLLTKKEEKRLKREEELRKKQDSLQTTQTTETESDESIISDNKKTSSWDNIQKYLK